MSKIEVEVIPENAEINITVGGTIYARLNQLIFGFFEFKDKEEYDKILEAIKSGNTQNNPKAYHLQTILVLHEHIEKCAREQGKTKKVMVDKEPTEEDTPQNHQSQE